MFGFLWKIETFIAAMAVLGIVGIVVALITDAF